MMTETQRTCVFAVVALASLVIAVVAAPGKPRAVTGFTEVGKPFYPDFNDADQATSLEVFAYDSNLARENVFAVQLKDGVWRIPSRHNYPADGKERLGKCAASVIGLKREAVAGTRKDQHAEFEVIDPLDDASQTVRRGKRLTLKDKDGKALVDLIVGKEVPNRTGYFYLRRPDEDVTYTAKIELDLSTKFADWIEPDLLQIEAFRLTGMTVDNYSVDLDRGQIVGREQNVLSRKTSSDPWSLKDLEATSEEVNQDEVRKMVDGLDNLKIIGVRPKPAQLQKDLRLAEGLQLDQFIMLDLQQKGFFFAPNPDGDQQLYAKEGALTASTDQGVQYHLQFGEVFTGTEEEIEFGSTKSEEEKASAADADGAKDGKEGAKPAEPSPSTSRSRFLFVTVDFDPELLGPAPVKPTEPEPIGDPPAGEPPAARGESDPVDASVPDNVGPWAEYLSKKALYDAMKAKLAADQAKYETDVKAYEEKVKTGEKLVKELNVRFADWYYAISADSFENLRQGRQSLVKPKTAAATPGQPPQFDLGAPN
jgi:hypothetical protein